MQYLGHSAFLWTGPDGTRVIADPYDTTHPSGWQWFLKPFPDVDADFVFVTHDHFDHNATYRVGGDPRVVRTSGRLTAGDLTIDGYEDEHATPDDIPNTIFVLDAASVRICHLGDNRPDVRQEVIDAIGDVDVLIVPVDDSSHLLRFWEIRQLVESFRPRVVVPVHYLIPGLTDPGSTLLPPDTWLATQASVKRVEGASVDLSIDTVPSAQEVWVFDTGDA